MWWLGLLLSAGLVLLLIYGARAHVFHQARRNCLRLDGTRSPYRTRKELRRFADLLGELVLMPLAVLTLAGGLVLVVHHFIIPIDMVRDIFSMYDSDPAVWEERLETGRLGDVGVEYLEWREAQGLSLEATDTWREFLGEHWMGIGAFCLFLGVLGYLFVVKAWRYAMARYRKGVLRRSQLYRETDLGILQNTVSPVQDADYEVL